MFLEVGHGLGTGAAYTHFWAKTAQTLILYYVNIKIYYSAT